MSYLIDKFKIVYVNLYKWKKNKMEYYNFGKSLKTPKGKNVLIIGIPEYINLGDSAIAIAQKKLIKKSGYTDEQIKEISLNEYYKYNSVIKRSVSKKTLITCIGGGNMGDEWFVEEELRRKVLSDFPKNKVIVFPQTIFYTNTDKGKEEENNSISYYNKSNCCVIAREKKSYEIMKKLYPKANVILTPDIVLSTYMSDYDVKLQKRNGVLWCMRSDAEKSITDKMLSELEKIIRKADLKLTKTDMYADVPFVTNENRFELVKNKMQQFSSSELVVTDRLHGMVFAALTGTPCVVFGNYNHKVSGTYEWIKHLTYIKYVDTVQEANESIHVLLQMSDCKFDNSSIVHYYDKIISEIK